MFQITFFVDDKNLGEAFKRLAGIARDLRHVYVPNVEGRTNGKLRVTGNDALELITKEFHRRHMTEITGSDFRPLVEKLGLSSSSYSYYLQSLVKAGVLKKGKKVAGPAGASTMTYSITGK